MPAVTVATGWPRSNVKGSYQEKLFKVTVTNNGDTLVTGLKVIKGLTCVGSGAGVHPVEATASGGTVTFATDGTADAAVFVSVTGW